MSEINIFKGSVSRGGADEAARLLSAPARFLDMLPIAIYACGTDGRLAWFNQRAVEIWGRRPKIGDASELFCGSLRLFDLSGRLVPHADTPMARSLTTGETVDGAELVVERPDGSRVTAMAHIEVVRDEAGGIIGAINCFHDITAQREAERDRREARLRARAVLTALPTAIYTTDAEGRITFFNDAAVELWGTRPELHSHWCGSWRLYHPDGSPMPHDECPMAVALRENRIVRGGEAVAERPDGTRVPFLAFPTPLRDASGALVGAVNMLIDITDRRNAEARQQRLMDELNHRVKNTLSTVQSLAAQTMRGARVSGDVRETFEARLFALSRTHNQLSRASWESADLGSILGDIFSPFADAADGRVRFDGSELKLPPRPALTLAMVFHELATNAVKYGALLSPLGTLSVSWRVIGERALDRLHIEWREVGGPRVQEPARRGFGSRLLSRAITGELKGNVRTAFEPEGFACDIDLPLPVA